MMNEFDIKAAGWDANPVHLERSEAIAIKLKEMIPLRTDMDALEFGAGTGILSLLLKERFASVTMIDSSAEMIRIILEKIAQQETGNMKAMVLDIENGDLPGKFDIVYSQMVLHHVKNTGRILQRFHELLNPGGYLAIADLYLEDGSFHDEPFDGHPGFDPERLTDLALRAGFSGIRFQTCFVMKKEKAGKVKEYPVFLMAAKKEQTK